MAKTEKKKTFKTFLRGNNAGNPERAIWAVANPNTGFASSLSTQGFSHTNG